MKITPVASPHAIVTPQTTPNAEARARAVAMLTGDAKTAPQPQQGQHNIQETPVANPNQVSVEELTAIHTTQEAQSVENLDNSTPNVEAKADTKPQSETVDTETNLKFAQLAKQERALRARAKQQEQALRAKEAELQQKQAEFEAKEQQYRQNYIEKSRIKQDALSALDEVGVTYDEVTQQALTRQPTDPRILNHINKLEQKIQELEQQSQQSQKSYQEQQTANYQAALKQIERDAADLVKSDNNFEAIRTAGAIKDVVDLIERTYKKDGVVLTVEEAAKEVEDYLVDEALKYTRLEKIRKRIEASAQPKPAQKQAPVQEKPQMKTLTNSMSNTRPLTARERAIAAMEGRLKS